MLAGWISLGTPQPVGNPGLAAAGLLLVLTGAVIRYVARRPALRDC